MTSRKKEYEEPTTKPLPRVTTPEAREAQLINLALDQIEEELREKRASSQVLSHYAKLASSTEALQQERIRMEIELGHQKKENMASAARMEVLMEEAMQMFSGYVIQNDEVPPDLEWDD